MCSKLRKTRIPTKPNVPQSKYKGKLHIFLPILASQKRPQKIEGLILTISHSPTYPKDNIKEIWATFYPPASHLGHSPGEAKDTIMQGREKQKHLI